MTKQVLIELESVSFEINHRIILKHIDFKIKEGEIIGIMGASGAGKSTLMKIITGQLQPSSGIVRVFGENIHQLRKNDLLHLRKKMSMMFQNNALFTDLNLFDNIAFPLREQTHLSEEIIDILVKIKLQKVGLLDFKHLYPNELSGGMARRAALARAIALDPSIIVYDEPFTGQDPISLGILVQLLYDLNRNLNLTSIIVSHDVHEVLNIVDKVFFLHQGIILEEGSKETMLSSSNPNVQDFFHSRSALKQNNHQEYWSQLEQYHD